MNRRFMFARLLPALVAIIFVGTETSAWADPELSFTPDTVDFGVVPIGARRTDSLIIENTGDDSLLILELLAPKSPEYRLTSLATPFFLGTQRFVRIGIELRARDTGCAVDRIVVVTEAGFDTLIIRRCAVVEQIVPEAEYNLPFPDTEINRCSRKDIRLTSPWIPSRLYGIYSDDPDAVHFHALTSLPYDGLELTSDPEPELSFEFCPKIPGSFQARFRCVTDIGIFVVRAAGTTLPSPARYFYLDTVAGNVGEAVTLQLIVDPLLTIDDRIDSIELTIRFDQSALVLQDVRRLESPGGGIINVSRSGVDAGTEHVMMRSVQGYITGQTLLYIEFAGLSTGKPSNVVRLDGRISGISDTTFFDGLILLEGCTLGASGFGKRITVESLTLDPSGTHVILRYSAPEGADGEVAVIDASGTEVTRFNLEPGSAAPQEWRLSLEGLFPGLFGLLIEVADDRVIVPFISPR